MYRTLFAAAVLSAALAGCSSNDKVPTPTTPDSIPTPPVSSSKSPRPVAGTGTVPSGASAADPR